jgi:hypothetical protein
MGLLSAETGFHAYGTYVRWRMPATMWWLIVPGLLAFTRILGMDPQEAAQLCIDATAATKNKSVHSYYPQ